MSAQYFVQAMRRSSSPRRSIVEVTDGCNETTRCGVKSAGWERKGIMKCDKVILSVREQRAAMPGFLYLVTMYRPQLLDHFQHPRNAGAMDSPEVSVQAENPACGDVMKLMLRIRNNKIEEAKYQVRGCVAAIACGSALTEALIGKNALEARGITRESIVDILGALPNESVHASHLAIDCLQLALKQWK
ncbi:MAG: hypothetical protein DMG64_09280 [Acidobacteria bacterium]|nr:MAG: hypothetical protein DMG64_09280 [Acidobacteriota bacterium]PYY21984.1 MAG: hypothetical protein DMG62_15625 [Acidobacteriota bacterium]